MEGETKDPKIPWDEQRDLDGYDIPAKLVRNTSPFGEWTSAVWDCPPCGQHYEYHGAGPPGPHLAAAIEVIATLNNGRQIRDTCVCGARQRIRRALVHESGAGGIVGG